MNKKHMKRILCLLLFVGFLTNLSAQNTNMKTEILRKIEVESFSNKLGLEMGLAIIKLARERKQNVAVKVERLNHTIFLYLDGNLPADKHLWLERKANVAKRFEQSSWSVKNDLINGNMTLKETFALDDNQYLAKGGAIPIFVRNAGMIAIITVSGLHDEEDHKIIIDALQGKFFD